jgi:hypothetical protein
VRTRAIIVGIDDYAGQPLTAAVNDACEFHDTILACRLAGESDIVLLTSPRRAEATGEATHQNIINALYAAYTSGDAFERLLFHFSGHGLLAFSNAQQNRTRTALVAREVEELDRDGRYLIDFTELLDVMEAAGPREQFYFVDACRDMSYSRQPGVGVLGWAATGRLSQRTQRCIYAVSPLGQALAIPGERGIFTDELCRALRDPIAALDFDPPADRYVVTTESLFDYVKTIVRERLKNEPFWAKSYNLPARFANESDPPTPLRATRDPGDVPFTVHIVPDSAQDATKVTLKMGPVPLSDEYCYPKRKNHETVYLKPQYVRLRAESTFGQTDPSECTVDLRREHQQTIHVGAPPVEPPAPQIGPSPPQVTPVIDPINCRQCSVYEVVVFWKSFGRGATWTLSHRISLGSRRVLCRYGLCGSRYELAPFSHGRTIASDARSAQFADREPAVGARIGIDGAAARKFALNLTPDDRNKAVRLE